METDKFNLYLVTAYYLLFLNTDKKKSNSRNFSRGLKTILEYNEHVSDIKWLNGNSYYKFYFSFYVQQNYITSFYCSNYHLVNCLEKFSQINRINWPLSRFLYEICRYSKQACFMDCCLNGFRCFFKKRREIQRKLIYLSKKKENFRYCSNFIIIYK